MPLAIYGDNTAPLILPTDAGKEKPRTLRIRIFSKTEMRAWQKRQEAAFDIAETYKRDEVYDKLLSEVVAGWDNIDVPFSIAAISEQYMLDLEREAFKSLCGERKTQERIQHTLKTGKTLRN